MEMTIYLTPAHLEEYSELFLRNFPLSAVHRPVTQQGGGGALGPVALQRQPWHPSLSRQRASERGEVTCTWRIG